jgi:hypothetical protein
MKASIKFDMNGIEVFQDIECPNHTKEEIIEGLNNGDILTGINSGAFIIDIKSGFAKIGRVLTTEFEHDIPYKEFELTE